MRRLLLTYLHFGIVRCTIHFWWIRWKKLSKSVKICNSYCKKSFTPRFYTTKL